MDRSHVIVCLAGLLTSVLYRPSTSETFSLSKSVNCSSDPVDDVASNSSQQLCFQRFNCSWSTLSAYAGLRVDIVGGGDSNFTITQDKQNPTVFFLCSNQSSSDIPDGTYQFLLAITLAGSANMSVYLNITVEVGEVSAAAPEIEIQDSSNFTVLENVTVGYTILEINVTDPSALDSQAQLDVLLHGSGDVLTLRNVSGSVYALVVSKPLNATDKSIYDLQITAENQCNLTAFVNLSVIVIDVNEAPVCRDKEVEVVVSKNTSSGTVVGNLACWDWDVLPEFRQITFSPTSLFSILNITTNGSIVLKSKVTKELSSAAVVSVFAQNYPGVSTSVTVVLAIDDYTDPNCTSPNNISFPETAANGTCSNDTADCTAVFPGTVLTFNYSADGPFSVFSTQYNASSALQTSVCVADSLMYKIGDYRLDLFVFEKGMTLVRWYVTVSDVNQPPSFMSREYTFNIEDVLEGAPLAIVSITEGQNSPTTSVDTIQVWDPDILTDAFRFKQINVTDLVVRQPGSPLLEKLNVTLSPLEFSVTNKTFYTFLLNTTPPSAGFEYRFTLQAEDQSGLVDSANVTFYVNHTNQPPSCDDIITSVDLMAPVGTEVYTLNCTDPDSAPPFSSLEYHEYKSTGSADCLFINSTGTIKLQSALPVDKDNITFLLYVQDGGGLRSTAEVVIVINRSYPPTCDVVQTNATFQETDPAGACSSPVTCRDPSNRTLTLNVNMVGGQGERSVGINTTRRTSGTAAVGPGDVVLRVCTVTGAPHAVGSFVITVNVSSLLGNTSVTWYVRISDVNQAPHFQRRAYFLTVMENASVGFSLDSVRVATNITDVGSDTEIVVYDPDRSTDDFRVKKINASLRIEYVNGTQFENDSVTPIQLVNTSVRVMASLRADLVYLLNLTATDGQGLSDSATLNITVQDINNSPVCPPASLLSLDLLTSVLTPVYTLRCSDPDFSQTFRTLTYGMYTEWNYTLFNVSSATGDVILVNPVPRAARDLHLEVFALDGGGLRANVSLNFNVSGDYKPVCKPVYVPPAGVWTHGQCFKVLPHCSDPSATNNSFLKYNVSGNFLNAFTFNTTDNATYDDNATSFEFCYMNNTDGTYQLELRVDNGLGTYLWIQDITVVYMKATPRFTDNLYEASLNETAAVGDVVLRVQALVNGSEGDVVYTLLDKGEDFSQFFELNNQTGEIRVLASLVKKVGTTLTADISAEDPATTLNTTVPIEVTVQDVNEPPVCNSTTVSTTVQWNVTSQDVVAKVVCWDNDISSSFSQLTYSIGDDVGGGAVWGITNNTGEVFLTSRSRLSPSVTSFSRNVTVTDGTYSVTVLLEIAVQRTPPKPLAKVAGITTSNASLSWTVDPLYNDVIQGFIIELSTMNNVKLLSLQLNKTMRNYTISELHPLENYTIVVVVVGMDTNRSSDYLLFTTLQVNTTDVNLNISSSPAFDDVVLENSNVTATCAARTPGANNTAFEWSLAGIQLPLTPASNHLQVSQLPPSDNDLFFFRSQLVISGIRLSENGSLSCQVSSAGASVSVDATVIVVAAMTASLEASSPVVQKNTNANLTCYRYAGYTDSWTAVLSCNNSYNVTKQEKTVAKGEKTTLFSITVGTTTVTCRCKVNDSKGLDESNTETVFVLLPDEEACLGDGPWVKTPAGATVSINCTSNKEGKRRRTCGNTGQWENEDTTGCISPELKALNDTLRDLLDGVSSSNASDIVHTLASSTRDSQSLSQGDVMLTVSIMLQVTNLTFPQGQGPGETDLKSFTETADSVLQAPPHVWNSLKSEPFLLLQAVDKMGEAAASYLNNRAVEAMYINTSNIMLQVGRTSTDITFPNRSSPQSPDWVRQTENTVFLPQSAFPHDVSEVKYSAVIYRNLSNIFSQDSESSPSRSSNLSVNSAIMTATLAGINKINSPVSLTFEHLTSNFSTTSCQFVDFKNSASVRWSDAGCTVVRYDRRRTECRCDHLTNFAILMSPFRPNDIQAKILSYLTFIGCGISIAGLFLTIVVYAVLWRYVKSDRSVILINLCAVLLLAYVTFLSGVNRTENQAVCKAVAALLHYLFLVVFFLMLSEGLNIFIAIVIVFPTKSVIAWLLALAYGLPVIIVGVSLGVRLDGYSSPDFCWLSLKEGLLWAFVGPALAILLANFLVVVIVIRALVSSTTFITKDNREKTKSVVKAICVMTPVLGLTWVFSVLSVNEETIIFQYLFLAFNSVQGFLIFVFHCLLSKQVQEGMQHRRRRYLASSSTNDKSAAHRQSESMSSSNDPDTTNLSYSRSEGFVHQRSTKANDLDSGSPVLSHVNQRTGVVGKKSLTFDTPESAVAAVVSQTSVAGAEYSALRTPTYEDYLRDAETGLVEERESLKALASATVRSGLSTKTQSTTVSNGNESLKSSQAADRSGLPVTSFAVGVRATPSGTQVRADEHSQVKADDVFTRRALRIDSGPKGFTNPAYETDKWDRETDWNSGSSDRHTAAAEIARDRWERAARAVTSRVAVQHPSQPVPSRNGMALDKSGQSSRLDRRSQNVPPHTAPKPGRWKEPPVDYQ